MDAALSDSRDPVIIANLRYLITIHRCVSLFRRARKSCAGRPSRAPSTGSFDEGIPSCALRGCLIFELF